MKVIILCLICFVSSIAFASDFQLGVDIRQGQFLSLPYGTTTNGLTQFDFLGSYQLTPKISIDGGLGFSTGGVYETSYYYSYWSGYQEYMTQLNMNQFDAFAGPTIRVLDSAFSPTFGGVLDFSYRSLVQSFYGTSTSVVGLPSTSIAVGPSVGVDYKFAKDINVGGDVRFLFPSGGSSFYTAGLYMKFAF